ncbi:MAG: sensor histidine kinase [Rhodobacteraceae bacterium]|nr:sensor histidine kinase [Paracoccaceae bacterium]
MIHELVTNAAKYGALSVGSGAVQVATTQAPDGSYEITWSESGGPPITAEPTRRGFGSTIIERSIPYDLKGEAEVTFAPTGLTARFVVPANFISTPTSKPSPPRSRGTLRGPCE